MQTALPLPITALLISGNTIEEARLLAQGWDMRSLEDDWRFWVIEKCIAVKDANAHFLSFCRKRGAYPHH